MGNSTSYLHELFKSASILSGGWMLTGDLLNVSVFPVVGRLVLHAVFCVFCVSVSQRNNSDCIYICVMAGKMGKFSSLCRMSAAPQRVIVWPWCVLCPGREVSELWQVDSITPLFNQTIVEGPHRGLLTTHTDFLMRMICNQTTRWQQQLMIEPELLSEEWREDWMERASKRRCSPVFFFDISSSSSSFSSRQHLLHQTACRWVTHHTHSSICCHLI